MKKKDQNQIQKINKEEKANKEMEREKIVVQDSESGKKIRTERNFRDAKIKIIRNKLEMNHSR
jgi:hypothetical protein